MDRGTRRRLPAKRRGRTYSLEIRGPQGTKKAHITINVFEDGCVGEIFVNTAKDGSDARTSIGAWAIQVSKSLQFGEPVRNVIKTYRGVRLHHGVIHTADCLRINGQPASSLWDAIAQLLECETRNGIHVDFMPETVPVPAKTSTIGVVVDGEDCPCGGMGWIAQEEGDSIPCPDHPSSSETEALPSE